MKARMMTFVATMMLSAATLHAGVDVTPNPNVNATKFNSEVLRLTNEERAKYKLKPLVLHPILSEAAEWKAHDLSTCGFFDHKDSKGRSPKDRIVEFGYYDWARVSENIAGGYVTPEEVVDAWMKSPGHRVNILDPKVCEIGLAFYFDSKSRHGYYWVQNFGRRLSQ